MYSTGRMSVDGQEEEIGRDLFEYLQEEVDTCPLYVTPFEQ